MNIQLTKMELIEMLLNTRKTSVLKKVKAVLEEDLDQLTAEDYQIIDARRNRHLSGESKSFSWEDAKQSILKL
ncbi:hypothetical protein [Flavobacterium sp.]|uniref:hypothetical protein n=1 Tax=Flavobacterium sp. TaxID=239 RepID=UPI00286C66D0|nr:hypothetical protein [Flavobacterium sp.]